jgi:hypothetical protein
MISSGVVVSLMIAITIEATRHATKTTIPILHAYGTLEP